MGKRRAGAGGHYSKLPGKSPRFRATQQIELRQQEEAAQAQAAARRPSMIASTVGELFHPKSSKKKNK